jgi:hypothetical protein
LPFFAIVYPQIYYGFVKPSMGIEPMNLTLTKGALYQLSYEGTTYYQITNAVI